MTQVVHEMKEKTPFVTTFGDYQVEEKGGWLYCYEKDVQVHIGNLRLAVKELPKLPLRHQIWVGTKITDPSQDVHIWRDAFNIHIGCLYEPIKTFNQKYLQLIKHLNNK